VIKLEEYQRRRGEIEQKVGSLLSQEQQVMAQVERQVEIAELAGTIEGFCRRVENGLAKATFEQRRELVELLIDRVVVTDEEVEIRYVIPTTASSEEVRFCHLCSDYQSVKREMKGSNVEPNGESCRDQWHMGRKTNSCLNRRQTQQAYLGYWLGPKWTR
jgi:site-specific DNA recombinase